MSNSSPSGRWLSRCLRCLSESWNAELEGTFGVIDEMLGPIAALKLEGLVDAVDGDWKLEVRCLLPALTQRGDPGTSSWGLLAATGVAPRGRGAAHMPQPMKLHTWCLLGWVQTHPVDEERLPGGMGLLSIPTAEGWLDFQ